MFELMASIKRISGRTPATVLRRQKFVRGLINGLSMTEAALAAGYSQSTADVACRAIMPQVREVFQEAMHRRISLGKLSDTVAAGLDANETHFFQHEGQVVETRNSTAWSERRRYAELATNLMDLNPSKVEVSGPNGQPLQVEIKLAHFGVVAKPDDIQK